MGIMVLYPGEDAPQLDQNLSNWLAEKGAGNAEIDAESFQMNYISIPFASIQQFRGKGIGSQLFAFAEDSCQTTTNFRNYL